MIDTTIPVPAPEGAPAGGVIWTGRNHHLLFFRQEPYRARQGPVVARGFGGSSQPICRRLRVDRPLPGDFF
jgi:hypothetical protein